MPLVTILVRSVTSQAKGEFSFGAVEFVSLRAHPDMVTVRELV